MKILCAGALNYDLDYRVEEIVRPGETITALSRFTAFGGKSFNQSVAMKNAGAEVYPCGILGSDGEEFLSEMKKRGIATDYIKTDKEQSSGHAFIQIDSHGQNSIMIYPGTNNSFTEAFADTVLAGFSSEDAIVLQNEINLTPYFIERAYAKGMYIVLNPSPSAHIAENADISKVSLLVVNEAEAREILGENIKETLKEKYPNTVLLMTLGAEGSVYIDGKNEIRQAAFPVKAVDTTAAGDTYLGFFLAGFANGKSLSQAMKEASLASSVAVTRPGASPSIPFMDEIAAML